MNTQIDVLAVMDAEITDLSQICDAEEVREYCFRQREAVLREARAAMDELIVAAKSALYDMREVRDRCTSLVPVDLNEHLSESIEKIAAALARIGGAG